VPGFDGDPDHPILPEPWRWELVEFTFKSESNDWRESYVDLVFAKHEYRKRLRFFAPQDIEISRGCPTSSGLCILDVSKRQLDGLTVRVACFEQSWGTPTFWAARVEEIPE
jgi:hypothetical protein